MLNSRSTCTDQFEHVNFCCCDFCCLKNYIIVEIKQNITMKFIGAFLFFLSRQIARYPQYGVNNWQAKVCVLDRECVYVSRKITVFVIGRLQTIWQTKNCNLMRHANWLKAPWNKVGSKKNYENCHIPDENEICMAKVAIYGIFLCVLGDEWAMEAFNGAKYRHINCST